MKRRILSILLISFMMAAMLPSLSWADDTAVQVQELHGSHTAELLSASGSTKTCKSEADIAKLIRKTMVNRTKTLTFKYTMSSSNINKATKALVDMAIEKAVTHTGVPNEGDYLRWNYGSYRWSAIDTYSGNKHNLKLTITFDYYTTKAQENELDSLIEAKLTELNIESKDDYAIVKSIYDWITSNVSYDWTGLKTNEIKCHTAYKAMKNGIAVCQGYTLLMYRMLNECGIDCRFVAASDGETGFNSGHAWNLVKLNGKYYQLDATWDAQGVQAGSSYKYFLNGKKDFQNHSEYTREDYIRNHAIADYSYKPTTEDVVQAIRPTSISSVTAGKKCINIKWKRIKVGINGYQIQYSTSSNFSSSNNVIINNNSTTSKKVTKLKSKKKYYVRVRSYKEVDGKCYYSKWSAKKNVVVR